MEAFDAEHVVLPLPDVGIVDGVSYYSQPVALRDDGDRMAIERVRTVVTPDGQRSASDDVIHLDKVDAGAGRGRGAGDRAVAARGARHPADRGARRHDGGDAPWLSCASARCIRTS